MSLVGLTASSELHVVAHPTYSMALDCTLRNFNARKCVVRGGSAHFEVWFGSSNIGTGYVMPAF